MKTIIGTAIIVCLNLCFLGCEKKQESAVPAAPAAAPPPVVERAPLPEPEYAVAIEESKTEPKKYSVTWTAKVSSGGWSMKTDNVLVEEELGKMAARIYVTIEEPNPSDKVTQAAETLTGTHDAGTTHIERVEFSVRQNVRGVKYDTPAGYYVRKTIKYPY